MIRALGWICLGITAHDLVSAYIPDGGHIPGFHAFYVALPLAITIFIYLVLRRRSRGEK